MGWSSGGLTQTQQALKWPRSVFHRSNPSLHFPPDSFGITPSIDHVFDVVAPCVLLHTLPAVMKASLVAALAVKPPLGNVRAWILFNLEIELKVQTLVFLPCFPSMLDNLFVLQDCRILKKKKVYFYIAL